MSKHYRSGARMTTGKAILYALVSGKSHKVSDIAKAIGKPNEGKKLESSIRHMLSMGYIEHTNHGCYRITHAGRERLAQEIAR